MLKRIQISPERYAQVTLVALVALILIVLTGSAVRLTASGLGCPDWPKCYGGYVAPAEINAWIEYGNRLLTGFVGFAVIAASLLAFARRPFRWHLALFGGLLPLGVIGHFLLSMILIDAAFALFWCSRHEVGERRFSTDRLGVWAVRCLIPIGQFTIFLGTITTASGPHPGDHDSELVRRFDFKGTETLEWIAQRHATMAVIFALSVLAVIFILRRQGGDSRAVKPLTVAFGLILLQITIGITQWLLELPAALVWVHVAVATFTWVSILWSVAAAGQLEAHRSTAMAGKTGI